MLPVQVGPQSNIIITPRWRETQVSEAQEPQELVEEPAVAVEAVEADVHGDQPKLVEGATDEVSEQV